MTKLQRAKNPAVSPPNRATSIHRVAEAANVSIATVSRVLNGKARVAPQTRARVKAAAKRLNYRPNAQARALTMQKSNTLGLVLPDLFGDYYGELMRGVDEGARETGRRLVVTRAKGAEEERRMIEELLGSGAVDGLILLVTELTDRVLESVNMYHDQIVVLDQDVNHHNLDNILVDNRSGARMATEHLLALGRRQLVFLGGSADNIDTRHRAEGFVDAARAGGIEVLPQCMIYTRYDYEAGFETGTRFAPIVQRGHCGVFAANDELARGFIQALETAGLRIPQDAAVVGYDDSRLARVVRPYLTSVRVPLQEIGQSAVRMLVQRLTGQRTQPAKMIFKGTLVTRGSTADTPDKTESSRKEAAMTAATARKSR